MIITSKQMAIVLVVATIVAVSFSRDLLRSRFQNKSATPIDLKTIVYDDENRKVIAYSFYGNNPERYSSGLIANVNALEKEFPGWHMYIYHDDTPPMHVLEKAKSMSKFVHVIDVAKQASMAGVSNRMSWRFLPLEDSTVERFIARDCDSRLTARDKATVNAWVASGKKFHVVYNMLHSFV